MQKRMRTKLVLHKETLHTLSQSELDQVAGQGTTGTSETSTPTLTCDSCFAVCSRNTTC